MNRNFQRIFAGGVAAVVFGLLAAGCAPDSDMSKDSANIRNVGDADFGQQVIKSDVPVVVDFYATWCGPCKRLAPMMEELAAGAGAKVKFVKVDIDRSPELARKYEIEGVPTVMMFKAGTNVSKTVGLVPREVLKEKIDTLTLPNANP